ncbi:MAG: hypothetical protein HY746_06155 [Elusimicrobia bacterium]|nr:hypothetical protein [Elusimicrobiota bacterium]
MTKSFLFLFFAALPLNSHMQEDLESLKLKGRIKSIKIMEIQSLRKDKKWIEGSPKFLTTIRFDSEGMQAEEEKFEGKTLVSKTRFERKTGGESGLCKKNEDAGAPFSIDGSGYSIKDFCKEFGKTPFAQTRVYKGPSAAQMNLVNLILTIKDKKGRRTGEYLYDSMGNFESRKTFKYDKQDRIIETAAYDIEGIQINKELVSYNDATHTKTVSVFDDAEQLIEKTIIEYRDNGALRKETIFSFDKGEQVLSKIESLHDSSGQKNRELHYSGNSEEPSFEYLYERLIDKNGNWTKETRIKMINFYDKKIQDKQEPPKTTRREIE